MRELDQQRSAVVIELGKVREERAAKEQAREVQRQRLYALPLAELRNEVKRLEPTTAAPGRPAWEREWQNLPDVVRADREAKEALHAVGQTEGKLTGVRQRLEGVFQAEQAYRKAHRIKAALHAVGLKDAQLKALDVEHIALEKRQIEDRQQLALAEQQRQAADAAWQRTASDPMLQAQAREIYGDKVGRWEDAQQSLVRRAAERRHAEELGEQLMAAQRLGAAFDRRRVSAVVREVLAYVDEGARMGTNERDRREAKVVDELTRDPGMRQGVERALAPQRHIIEQELQQEKGRGHGR